MAPSLSDSKDFTLTSIKMCLQKKENWVLSDDNCNLSDSIDQIRHPEKIVFPNLHISKLSLARYYQSISKLILPYVSHRPLTLVSCPEGAHNRCFFHKNWSASFPDKVLAVPPQSPPTPGIEPWIEIIDEDGLVELINCDVVEIHTWNSTDSNIEKADQVIFDLDPDENVEWPYTVEAALLLRQSLAGFGLESFLKTTGGKGLHLTVPLNPKVTWELANQFAARVAKDFEAQRPSQFASVMAKTKRKGKILIDHFRNSRGVSSIAPYSVRARPNAPVSLPLSWSEIQKEGFGNLRPQFSMLGMTEYLERRKVDPWKEFFIIRQTLPSAKGSSAGL